MHILLLLGGRVRGLRPQARVRSHVLQEDAQRQASPPQRDHLVKHQRGAAEGGAGEAGWGRGSYLKDGCCRWRCRVCKGQESYVEGWVLQFG